MGFDIAFLYAMRGYQTFVYDAAKAAMDALTDVASRPLNGSRDVTGFPVAR